MSSKLGQDQEAEHYLRGSLAIKQSIVTHDVTAISRDEMISTRQHLALLLLRTCVSQQKYQQMQEPLKKASQRPSLLDNLGSILPAPSSLEPTLQEPTLQEVKGLLRNNLLVLQEYQQSLSNNTEAMLHKRLSLANLSPSLEQQSKTVGGLLEWVLTFSRLHQGDEHLDTLAVKEALAALAHSHPIQHRRQ